MCARKVAPINEKSQLPAANIQKCPNLGHANPKESLLLLTKSILCNKLKFLRSINLNNDEELFAFRGLDWPGYSVALGDREGPNECDFYFV